MIIQLVNRDLEASSLRHLRKLRRTMWIVWLASVPPMWAVAGVSGSTRMALGLGAFWAVS
jgi:hypothetical protein